MAVVWSVSQGDQEYPASRYHQPPSEAPRRASEQRARVTCRIGAQNNLTALSSRIAALERHAPALLTS